MRTVIGIIAVLAALAAAAIALAYSGAYNVGADEPHWAITERLLGTIRDRSIQARARDIAVPDLADGKRIAFGAGQYADMCESCHLAPGMQETEISRGLYPRPPNLTHERVEPREAFWIVRHGVKLTGMPAWGPTHSDDVLWSVVAFLQKLPELDAKAYRDLVAQASQHKHSHPEHNHRH